MAAISFLFWFLCRGCLVRSAWTVLGTAKIGYCNTDKDLNDARKWGGKVIARDDYVEHVEWVRRKKNRGHLDSYNLF